MFFDNVSGYQISQTKFNEDSKNDSVNTKYAIAKDYITSFTNSDFELGSYEGWEKISAFPLNTTHKVINISDPLSMEDYKYLGSDNLTGNYALWDVKHRVIQALYIILCKCRIRDSEMSLVFSLLLNL